MAPQTSRSPSDPRRVQLDAPAKINLNLHVGPARADGYHPLDSLVVRLDFFDRITIALREETGLELTCPHLPDTPPQENLAWRAAELMLARAASLGRDRPGLTILLDKPIPAGAGLGGGSSDAAAVLAAMNDLLGLDLPPDELARLAATLGSDVPLFLGPPAVRMTGRGEILQPIDLPALWVVLMLPDLHCPTGAVYRAFDQALPRPLPAQLTAQELLGPPSTWRGRLVNHLEAPACEVCPPLGPLIETLRAALDMPVHLSGSGSSLFVLCDSPAEAGRTARAIPPELGLAVHTLAGQA